MYTLRIFNLRNSRLRFSLNLIVIALFCFTVSEVGIAQVGVTISGSITDHGTGDPLPGGNVVILGTTLGAASDPDGNYIIHNVPPGNYQLQCRFIGYKSVTQSITVNVGQEITVNFELDVDPLKTEAVVVTGVASRTSKAVAPIAVQRISARELTEVSNYTSVHELLAGKIAGVSLQRAQGTFGAGTRMIVRSGGGINGDGQPVFYIDGVKVENSVWDTGRG
ncbi:MAG: carboxypeptidase-like regulatory domain-containing protein, partial [bacterium]